MSLKDINLEENYRTGDNDLISEFYIPCLANSIRYDRAVGYFNSSIINYISNGLYQFIKNNGRMRLICSIQLSKKDSVSLKKGYKMKNIIGENLNKKVDLLLNDSDKANIKNLSWLIKEGYLDIKIAIRKPEDDNYKNYNSMYHEKFGVFTDEEGDKVVFSGSLNESSNGWIYNFESIDVFWSWQNELQKRVKKRIEYFRRLWNNSSLGVEVYDFPEASKRKLIKIAPSKPINKIYKLNPSKVKENSPEYKEENNITPRDYQLEAINNWKENNYKGLFEMATGTGKTITSILCAEEFIKDNQEVLIIIVCPYQHLVDQWEEELNKFNYRVINCYKSKKLWENKLIRRIVDLNIGISKCEFVITTVTTASMKTFEKAINRIDDKVKVLLIGDEVHHLGSNCRRSILKSNFIGRIGLSATPKRWHDEDGTKILYDYFNGVTFSYDLEKAIDEGFLTPYEYHPILIELTNKEFENYKELSVKIAKMLASGVAEDDETLTGLMIKRSGIVNSAKNKIEKFRNLISREQDLKYTLVYTSHHQMDNIQDVLNNQGVFYQRFTARENNRERQRILKLFANGDIGVLVAMHCLDEGVNVPATKKAYILSSSSNPKEFIQRRGRVLRKYPGKEKATIYDFIAIPPDEMGDISSIRSILRRELARFKEFADISLNKYQARKKIFDLANYYNLLDEV
ncbi:DEAD/DEAH box helicase family protein [Natroniella sulfidigena]|uniref:DEAD/DEAH box helicase family protein n=1 Tax=Natroniella sulfidigena TaxID=723921 RepID=UPI00200AC714|nr:DEAD/DEAH box helicase family protein [Natroniella sulfidigena]MCK8817157.1 DEAD/DEAH box helicase family protein [Natroniella sulfidigena]